MFLRGRLEKRGISPSLLEMRICAGREVDVERLHYSDDGRFRLRWPKARFIAHKTDVFRSVWHIVLLKYMVVKDDLCEKNGTAKVLLILKEPWVSLPRWFGQISAHIVLIFA